MAEARSSVRYLFFVPSFYGALAWGGWLLLYSLKLIRVDACDPSAAALYLAVEGAFVLSAAVSLPYFRSAAASASEMPGSASPAVSRFGDEAALTLLHAIGFLGLTLYVVEFSRNLGGIAGFFIALFNEAYAIRWEAETSASIGTQLSYVGWIAIALSGYLFARRRIPAYWLVPALVQFLANFLFIDRTRPFWILFTTFFSIISARGLAARKIVRLLVCSALFAVAIFWSVAEWTGKTAFEGKYDDSVLPGITQEIYAYGISGFAYFSKVMESGEPLSYLPERAMYPLFKLSSKLGLTREPPPQILDFYDVPFATNVGTFLEPFYRDGGLLFACCGILLYSFGFDLLGLHLLRSGNPLSVFAWSNLCFVTAMSFFTPQAMFFPTWLFTVLGIAGAVAARIASGALPASRAAR